MVMVQITSLNPPDSETPTIIRAYALIRSFTSGITNEQNSE